jgi:hypothetical protein
MKKIIIILIASFSLAITAKAQSLHNLYGVSWEVGFPIGDFYKKSILCRRQTRIQTFRQTKYFNRWHAKLE